MTPARLLHVHERNRFVRPSAVDAGEPARLEALVHERLSERAFTAVALSPLCPLGTVSAVATTSVHDDEDSCFAEVRYLVSLWPPNNREPAVAGASRDAASDLRPALASIVPPEPNKPYDMRSVVAEIVDDGDYLEVHEDWAPNVICLLARVDGATVGIVGNQPIALAGVLDVQAAQKAARFVRFCDAFGIPLVTLVDVPGFLPGTDQEQAGVIRHAAKLLCAYFEATVPRISIILRKAYGGAYIVMDSRPIGCDLALAWPSNEIAVMGAEGAVNTLFRKGLATAADPHTSAPNTPTN